jgi:hypothetical protein
VEATGWSLGYVARLPLPAFWRVHAVLARRPSAARVARLWSGAERPEGGGVITRDDVEEARAGKFRWRGDEQPG